MLLFKVLLQVPQISKFQWHPFTISAILGHRLQLTIKADGDWTRQILSIATTAIGEGHVKIAVGIDGPFGAPAQRFYSFDKSIIIGAGIGITPYAACLTDLEENYNARGDPWKFISRGTTRLARFMTPMSSKTVSPYESPALTRVNTQVGPALTRVNTQIGPALTRVNTQIVTVKEEEEKRKKARIQKPDFVHEMKVSKPGERDIRRVDFHWSVRDKNQLLWFADLLNRAEILAEKDGSNLTLNIHAHVTAARMSISTHVFRYLLDSYRTVDYPYSALTGLRSSAHFGRPDYSRIMLDYYNDLAAQGWTGRVGVFFCGPAVIGTQLADQCSILTAKARTEGKRMRFICMTEVFG